VPPCLRGSKTLCEPEVYFVFECSYIGVDIFYLGANSTSHYFRNYLCLQYKYGMPFTNPRFGRSLNLIQYQLMKKLKPTANNYVKLPGSAKAAPALSSLNTLNPLDAVSVTIRVRRKKSIERALKKGKIISREEYDKQFGAADEDIAMVEAFAAENHLTIIESSKARRSVIVKGTIGDLEKAFQVHLANYKDKDGQVFYGRSGNISIPATLENIVEGVFGLDNRPNADPKFIISTKENGMFVAQAAGTSYSPAEISKIYGFPKTVTGKKQCIAIIELGGGFRNNDLTTYFAGLGIATPVVKAVSVDGAINKPTSANSDDGEVMLDIEVAGAIAPGATIVVYFAPNTDKGFLDAITTAVHDNLNKPSVISISWGAAEKSWTSQSLTNFNEAFKTAALLGVTICAAAGDQGSDDNVHDGKVHADFPSSSPYVLSCGGTKLVASGIKITSETVWHASSNSATGGGVSDFFPLPDYQKTAKVPLSIDTKFKGRGVPDVAGNADPATGYKVRVDGQDLVIGGTSAVAPLMAGLIALLNEKNGKPSGFINPVLYANPAGCRDITMGDNITTSNNKGYKAGAGWDACTGWGVMNKL
jgi:kumamolisin